MSFAVPACANCGHAVWPPRLACSVCGAAEWIEVDASTGTVLEVTETPGASGKTVRFGTVQLDVGPPVIAVVEGAVAGEKVELELRDRALRAAVSK
jgi:uncharacterized OB-fold protein